MRTTSRLLPLLAVAVAASFWGAGAADGKGKPCASPPCDGSNPPDASVELDVEANLAWAHEPSDTIVYTITVTNGSDDEVHVTGDLVGDVGTVPAGGDATFIEPYGVAPHYAPHPGGIEFGDDPVSLTHEVTATAGGRVLAVASVDVELHHDIAPCDFTGVIDRVCIWRPTEPGDWAVTVDPTPVAKPGRNSVLLTLRDHVPGNWCASSIVATWVPSDAEFPSTVFTIPDWTQVPQGDPVCPDGATTDGYGVGTAASFYLVAGGDVTAEPAG